MPQQVDITDIIVRAMDHKREVADTVGVTDSAQSMKTHIRQVMESLGITDDNFAGRIIYRIAKTPRVV